MYNNTFKEFCQHSRYIHKKPAQRLALVSIYALCIQNNLVLNPKDGSYYFIPITIILLTSSKFTESLVPRYFLLETPSLLDVHSTKKHFIIYSQILPELTNKYTRTQTTLFENNITTHLQLGDIQISSVVGITHLQPI